MPQQRQDAKEAVMSGTQPATRAAPISAPATQRTSKMAIWSLVLSILWLGGLGSVAGILLGISACRRIAGTGERGAGLAVAGVVVGVITLLFAVAYWAVLAMHTGGSGGSGGGGGGGY
jgi:VIT1/CCC1 family predicted Fe2+/Mn2+ transporter